MITASVLGARGPGCTSALSALSSPLLPAPAGRDIGAGAVAGTLDGTLGGSGPAPAAAVMVTETVSLPRYTLVTLPNWSTVATSVSLLVHSTVTWASARVCGRDELIGLPHLKGYFRPAQGQTVQGDLRPLDALTGGGLSGARGVSGRSFMEDHGGQTGKDDDHRGDDQSQ